jgi:hypothetical protein
MLVLLQIRIACVIPEPFTSLFVSCLVLFWDDDKKLVVVLVTLFDAYNVQQKLDLLP